MQVLGLDIGGANLKAAHEDGTARLMPFALWKQPRELPERLRTLVDGLPAWDTLAVTITGELCDCFATKRAGVHAILQAVRLIAPESRIRVWTNRGGFVDWASAVKDPLPCAAANWRALGQFALALADPGPGLLIDIGSTTTDTVPWDKGALTLSGLTDPERLRAGELMYAGARRTPLCALLGVGYAAEFFATMADAVLLLNLVEEDAANCDTADGRPATRSAAAARLARMVCGDSETCSPEEITRLAQRALHKFAFELKTRIETIAEGLSGPPATVVLAGSGELLAQRLYADICPFLEARVVSFAAKFGSGVSDCGCAYAVARLCHHMGQT
jgi:(4-(4-[2-(gamma-L-glutamylamino)ethyl]phenoxymethyl)furan-2-yl)methanamine synthase